MAHLKYICIPFSLCKNSLVNKLFLTIQSKSKSRQSRASCSDQVFYDLSIAILFENSLDKPLAAVYFCSRIVGATPLLGL